jgi:hypothetical protein
MDVTLPGASGIEAIRHIRQYDEAARIVVFTMHQGAAFALKAVEAGAAGYVTKSSDPANLIEAIFGVLEGRTVISPDVIEGIAQDRISGAGSGLDELSTRQTEIRAGRCRRGQVASVNRIRRSWRKSGRCRGQSGPGPGLARPRTHAGGGSVFRTGRPVYPVADRTDDGVRTAGAFHRR